MSMRIVFMGTGDIALPALRRLLESPWNVVGVVAQPDKPVGRHQTLTPPRIKQEALAAGIPVLQPERVRRRSEVSKIAGLQPDVIVVMAYGQLLPPSLLEVPRIACINLHASLLPKYRGASCIQAALLAGDLESGITVMHMSAGMDEGDVILRKPIPLSPAETGGSLHDRLAELAPKVLMDALCALQTGSAEREPQDSSLATYAPKLDRNAGEIDWSEAAVTIERKIRALDPWPGTFTTAPDSRGRQRRLKLFPGARIAEGKGDPGTILSLSSEGLGIACGEGSLVLGDVQPDGGRRLPAAEAAHGWRWAVGTVFR